jgi:predicted transcriptional regulator
MDLRSPLLAHIPRRGMIVFGERRRLLEAIPEVVRTLVARHIHSVDILEILLLLRQEPQKEWGALAISKALRLDRTSVHSRLQQLLAAGLVSNRFVGTEEVFRYQPATSELRDVVSDLAKWYSSHRVALISFIYSNPADRIQTYPGQAGNEGDES